MNKDMSFLSIINDILDKKETSKVFPKNFFSDLSGKIIKIRIEDLSYEIFMIIKKDIVELISSSEKIDVEILSSLANYLLFIISKGSSTYSSKIKINGDIDTASKFNSYLSNSDYIKDTIASIIGTRKYVLLEKFYNYTSEKFSLFTDEIENSIKDFLMYDLDILPSKHEIDSYLDDVDDLKSRTEKLLQKYNK